MHGTTRPQAGGNSHMCAVSIRNALLYHILAVPFGIPKGNRLKRLASAAVFSPLGESVKLTDSSAQAGRREISCGRSDRIYHMPFWQSQKGNVKSAMLILFLNRMIEKHKQLFC